MRIDEMSNIKMEVDDARAVIDMLDTAIAFTPTQRDDEEFVEQHVKLYKKYARGRIEEEWKAGIEDAKVQISMNPKISALLANGCSSHEAICRGEKLRLKAQRQSRNGEHYVVFQVVKERGWIGLDATFQLTVKGREKKFTHSTEGHFVFGTFSSQNRNAQGFTSDIGIIKWSEFLDDYVTEGRFIASIIVSITKCFHFDSTVWDVDSEKPYIRFQNLL